MFHDRLRPTRDFSKSWAAVCKAEGIEGTLVHDMRRSCTRNLVRAGVPEGIAMQVTGHKTRSMFDRYNIVAASDLESAMTSVSEYITAKESEPVRTNAIPLVRKAG